VGLALSSMITSEVSPTLEVVYSWVAMLLFLIPILLFARRNKIPLSEFGMRKDRWQRWALEGLLLAVPVVLMLSLAKRVMYGDVGPLITFARYESYPMPLMAFDLLFYLPHTFLQELAARGLVQGSLQRFMEGSHPLVPVLVASSLFGVGHLYAGFAFAFLMLVGSFILGLLYLHQRSLIGVTIAHFVGGLAALAFGLF
jgi:membrane protease YdiL (CAAX protease family)